MSILVFVESDDGIIKKSSFEAIAYGAAMGESTVITLGQIEQNELEALGKYGAAKVLNVSDSRLNHGVIQAYANVIAQAMSYSNSNILVMAKSSLGDAIGARVAAKIDASLAANVVELPDTSSGFKVKRSIFTGNAFAIVELLKENKIISIRKNAIGVTVGSGTATVEEFKPELNESDFSAKIISTEKADDDILLSDAEIIVSGGRGMKGSEHWGILEDLAKSLGAAMGCSKPVSDMEWRPHHEHVGQTGIKVGPNLYIAVGISGAIQHVAGVNSSKVIVVINKDSEAPFFKIANYGIVGDAFEVVPKLTEAVKALN